MPGSEPPTQPTVPARVPSVSADPIDSDDPVALRAEILALRDQLAAADGGKEILEDLVAEHERHIAELANELARNPVMRIGRALRRRLRRR
jgi:hypothetical protein